MYKKIIRAIAFLSVATFATDCFAGDVYVNGYTRQDGTYVNGYYRTAPDSDPYNNYSSKGNYNPYTGQAGTVTPSTTQSGYSYNPSLPPINTNGVGANLDLGNGVGANYGTRR